MPDPAELRLGRVMPRIASATAVADGWRPDRRAGLRVLPVRARPLRAATRGCVARWAWGLLRLVGAMALALTWLLATGPAVLAPPAPFLGVAPGFWANPPMLVLMARGVLAGSAVHPNRAVTRAQFAVLLARAAGWGRGAALPFDDVPRDAWYAPGVAAVAGRDVLGGTAPGRFSPEAPLTRAMTATALVRALGLSGAAAALAAAPLPYDDAATIPPWAQGSVGIASRLGLMSGADGAFSPSTPLTRAQAVAVLARLVSRFGWTVSVADRPPTPVRDGAGGAGGGPAGPESAVPGAPRPDPDLPGAQSAPHRPAAGVPGAQPAPHARVAAVLAGMIEGPAAGLVPASLVRRLQALLKSLAGIGTQGSSALPAAAVRLIVDPVPTSILLPGQQARLRVWLGDAFGDRLERADRLDVSVVSGPGSVAGRTFMARSPGWTRLRLSVPGVPPAIVSLRTVADVAGKVAGTGIWMTYSDWLQTPASELIPRLRAAGVTHVYLEVEASSRGFYGRPALADLLRRAHAAGIAVIAWVYPYLDHPQADLRAARRVIAYRSRDGSRVDGLAADLEQRLAPGAVRTYAAGVRAALGPDGGPFVAVTLPPSQRPDYPYAQLAPYVDVWAPMDYWHVYPRPYDPVAVERWVRDGLASIRRLSGRPGVAFDPILQSFDAFSQPAWDPAPDELRAAVAGALSGGAAGVGYYRLGTIDAAQWSVIRAAGRDAAPWGRRVAAGG